MKYGIEAGINHNVHREAKMKSLRTLVLVAIGFFLIQASPVGIAKPQVSEEDKKKSPSKSVARTKVQKKELEYDHQTFIKMYKKDPIKAIQYQAILEGQSELGHWGWEPDFYTRWGTHSNRLIPVYTFGTKSAKEGVRLSSYTGEDSVYRRKNDLFRLYKAMPSGTANPNASYMDQTDIFKLQQAALEAGKKNIFLVVFDGMDWQTTWAAAAAKSKKLPYRTGRGTGLHFQDYTAGDTTEFAEMVTSPAVDGTKVDVDRQVITNPGEGVPGGFDSTLGGISSWSSPGDVEYLVAKGRKAKHAYTDSAASATSMMSGIKTYNGSISVDPNGRKVVTIGHLAQNYGYKIGAVSSVPVSHATPACAYAHNVARKDYQDLTRDLLGLPSISHPRRPLSGMDVLIGGGYGVGKKKDPLQGKNYVPGNTYLTKEDLAAITYDPKEPEEGGPYLVAMRQKGINGASNLLEKAKQAAEGGHRLFGFYGANGNGGHLPYRTADGDYQPTIGRAKKAEVYSKGDIDENPTLEEMTKAALTVLEKNEKGMWLMVEAGDVDWANHDNNIDNSIGAVISGDRAVKVITDWVEKNSNWKESVLIVTADHGHYLVLNGPEMLLDGAKDK